MTKNIENHVSYRDQFQTKSNELTVANTTFFDKSVIESKQNITDSFKLPIKVITIEKDNNEQIINKLSKKNRKNIKNYLRKR